MLDTNAYDAFIESVKNGLSITDFLNNYELLITKIQLNEISALKEKDPEKWLELEATIKRLSPKLVPIPFTFDYIDFSNFSFVPEKTYSKILKPTKSNLFDALIAAASECEGCTLITHDKKLITKAKKAGCSWCDNEVFFAPYIPVSFYEKKESSDS